MRGAGKRWNASTCRAICINGLTSYSDLNSAGQRLSRRTMCSTTSRMRGRSTCTPSQTNTRKPRSKRRLKSLDKRQYSSSNGGTPDERHRHLRYSLCSTHRMSSCAVRGPRPPLLLTYRAAAHQWSYSSTLKQARERHVWFR